MAHAHEIVVTDCGGGLWLALVREPFGGRELWRIGNHAATREHAFAAAVTAWETDATHNIRAYKAGKELEA